MRRVRGCQARKSLAHPTHTMELENHKMIQRTSHFSWKSMQAILLSRYWFLFIIQKRKQTHLIATGLYSQAEGSHTSVYQINPAARGYLCISRQSFPILESWPSKHTLQQEWAQTWLSIFQKWSHVPAPLGSIRLNSTIRRTTFDGHRISLILIPPTATSCYWPIPRIWRPTQITHSHTPVFLVFTISTLSTQDPGCWTIRQERWTFYGYDGSNTSKADWLHGRIVA